RSRFISTPPAPRRGCWCACPSQHQLARRKNFPKPQKLRHRSELRKAARWFTLPLEIKLFSLGNAPVEKWISQPAFSTCTGINRRGFFSAGVFELCSSSSPFPSCLSCSTASYVNTFQIGNNTNTTKDHAIRKHKH